MKGLKVIFFGTPDFAKASLEAVFNSVHSVVGVVTMPDKPQGRGQKMHESPVKEFAIEHDLPVFQPEKLRNPEFLSSIRSLNADIFVVVAFRMMPKVLFSMPLLGTFNLHGSLLPDYRGASPINYAIINGEKRSGVTSFFINEKIDEGNILLQKQIEISENDNAGDLHDKLMVLGAATVVETLDQLAVGSLREHPQPVVALPKLAPKIFKEDLEIQWNQHSLKVYNFIRGMSPYPGAFTKINIAGKPKTFKIFKGHFEIGSSVGDPGVLERTKTSLSITTGDGTYFPDFVQLEGKRKMSVRDFLNGLQEHEEITIRS